MRYFPLFLDVRDRKALVVGGGEEALRKVRLLLKTEARIEIVAPELHPELTDLAVGGNIAWIGRRFVSSQLDGANLVFVAADATHQRAGGGRGEEARHPRQCRRRCRPLLGHRAGDRRPRPARRRHRHRRRRSGARPGHPQRLEASLPPFLGALTRAAGALRERVAERVPAGRTPPPVLAAVLLRLAAGCFRPRRPDLARELEAALRDAAAPVAGRVSLVGAGPGDPELLTLKAQRKLQEADVIVYDRLVGPGILELCAPRRRPHSGRQDARQPSPKQAEINAILIREAKAGQHVVRLKGGDPYVFGRGGEEQAALEAEGIPVDVVPGITAALGCAAADRPAADPARPERSPSRC